MKYVVIAQHDPNIFPNMYDIARYLADASHDVIFIATNEPSNISYSSKSLKFVKIKNRTGYACKIPLIRSNYDNIMYNLIRERPDWIIAQHEYVLPATIYKMFPGSRARIAACFVDFHGERRYVKAMKPLASAVDAHVDVCGLRVDWMKEVWPRMDASAFVVRNAPLKQPARLLESHQGTPRVVLTASAAMMLQYTNPDRFSRFAQRLCANGISLDWYLGARDHERAAARSLCSHSLYTVHDPLPKPRLLEALRAYDVGLFWAPMADCDPRRAAHRSVFISSASNKIGEYIATGLAVAHTGNPGLAYLPASLGMAFDATDPEASADQLTTALADRGAVERMRQAALNYHQAEMNFEAQAAPFLRYVQQPL